MGLEARNKTAIREVVLVFAGMAAASALIGRAQRPALIADNVHLLLGLLFLLAALRLAGRQPGGARRFGIDLGGLLEPAEDEKPRPGLAGALEDLWHAIRRALPVGVRETAAALAISALVFPPFVVGFYLWHGPQSEFVFRPPPELASYLAAQLLLVGLPEEALFRGYFQTRLSDGLTDRVTLFGVRFSPSAVVIQALLFALVHFAAESHPNRLAVFFPALLFGWMREWRGGIGASIVFHCLCNLLSDILVGGWL